jgi:two-component system, NarL family, response regulator NreC
VLCAQPNGDGVLELHEGDRLVATVRQAKGSRGPLTERDVMTLLARGQTNSDVANSLGISVRTAEMHRARIARKLGRTSRSGLVEWALQRGFVGF